MFTDDKSKVFFHKTFAVLNLQGCHTVGLSLLCVRDFLCCLLVSFVSEPQLMTEQRQAQGIWHSD